jgi:hypothetical protein
MAEVSAESASNIDVKKSMKQPVKDFQRGVGNM